VCQTHNSSICDMTHDSSICVSDSWLIHMWHDSFIRVTWLIHVCDMVHSCVWRGSFRGISVSARKPRDSFIRETWLINVCDMTHSHVKHDSFIRVEGWVDSLHLRVCRDTLFKEGDTHYLKTGVTLEVMCVSWLKVSYFEWRSSRSRNESSHTHEWVLSNVMMRDVTHMNESCHTWMSHVTHEWVMSHMNESCHT